MLRIGLLVILPLFACANNPPPQTPQPAPTQADCRAAVRAATMMMPDADPDALLNVKRATALHCLEDDWSVAATTCFAAATTRDAVMGCVQAHVTTAQHEALMHDLGAEMHAHHHDEHHDEPEEPHDEPLAAEDPPHGTQAEIAHQLNAAGEAWLEKKNYNEATAKFREAAARVPQKRYFQNLCKSLAGEGKADESRVACAAAHKLD